jgi:hypothetical protein
MKNPHFFCGKRPALLLLLLFAGIGAGRIISTYTVYSQTYDEAFHLAAGFEWLDRHRYTLDIQHPPLARVAAALGPYLSGLRLSHAPEPPKQGGEVCPTFEAYIGNLSIALKEGNDILNADNRYDRNLSLARLGILPFYILAAVLVFVWGRVFFGPAAAAVSVLLFTHLPPVLAHAGLVTTDTALAALACAALLSFVHFLDRPTVKWSLLLGLTTGLTALSKLSAVLYLPACFFALYLSRRVIQRPGGVEAPEGNDRKKPGRFPAAVAAFLAAFLVVWAGYLFSIGPLRYPAERPHRLIDHLAGKDGTVHDLAYRLVEAPAAPAPSFFRGINLLRIHNERGHVAYFMGKVRTRGCWYFFPVELLFKTPFPFLLFAAAGVFLTLRESLRKKDWRLGAPAVAATTVMLVGVAGSINVGIRHILLIYPLLAIAAGVGAVRLWNAGPPWIGRTIVLLLLAWQITSCSLAHPDYLPYASGLAGRHPERLLGESDIDWGQDLKRLAVALDEFNVQRVRLSLRNTADYEKILHVPWRFPKLHNPVTGWYAMSLMRTKFDGTTEPPYDGYAWLDGYEPVCIVGHSIKLYLVTRFPPVKRSEAGDPGFPPKAD